MASQLTAVGRSVADKADEADEADDAKEADEMTVLWGLGTVDLPPLQQATGRADRPTQA